jgi:hypothetical protein
MKTYLIKYTLRDGKQESVTIETNDLFNSLFQYERNRDVQSWDLIQLIPE